MLNRRSSASVEPILPMARDGHVPDQGILEQGRQRGHGALIADLAQGVDGREAQPGSRSSTFTSAPDRQRGAHLRQTVDHLLDDVDVLVIQQRDQVGDGGGCCRCGPACPPRTSPPPGRRGARPGSARARCARHPSPAPRWPRSAGASRRGRRPPRSARSGSTISAAPAMARAARPGRWRPGPPAGWRPATREPAAAPGTLITGTPSHS